jgi:hypothetical protein
MKIVLISFSHVDFTELICAANIFKYRRAAFQPALSAGRFSQREFTSPFEFPLLSPKIHARRARAAKMADKRNFLFSKEKTKKRKAHQPKATIYLIMHKKFFVETIK